MIKGVLAVLVAAGLAGCGAQGEPVAPARTGPVANVGVGIGPNGLAPAVTVADGIGRVSLGASGLRLGAAGIPLSLGL